MEDLLKEVIARILDAERALDAESEEAAVLRRSASVISQHLETTGLRRATRHVIGASQTEYRALPDLTKQARRVKRAALDGAARDAIINEHGSARNLDKLDLSGTHYQEEGPMLEWLIGL